MINQPSQQRSEQTRRNDWRSSKGKINRLIGSILSPIVTPLLALVIALLIGGILIWFAGESPLRAYLAMLNGAFGSIESLMRTLRWTGPLILSGVAAAVAFRAGIFNVGVEGSLWVGGLAASLTGIYIVSLPGFIHIPLVFIAGALIGGVWAILPAIARAKFNVNEVVSTLMLNYIAVLMVQYLIRYYFYHVDPNRTGMGGELYAYPETSFIQPTAELPWINEANKLSIAIFIAIGFALITHLIFKWSIWGYESKLTGLNSIFARFGGIATTRVLISGMVISGSIGGVTGALEVTGNYHRFISTMSVGLGFDGIAIALMGKMNPVGIIISSILFAALKVGGAAMERGSDVSRNIVIIVQALILMFVTAESLSKFIVLKHAQ